MISELCYTNLTQETIKSKCDYFALVTDALRPECVSRTNLFLSPQFQ